MTLAKKKSEIEAINKELSDSSTWENKKKSQSLQKDKKRLEKEVKLFSSLYGKKEELEVLVEVSEEGEREVKYNDRNLSF